MMDALYAHRCPHCEGLPSAAGGINLDDLLNRAIQQVYKGNSSKVQQQLSEAYAAQFSEAVNEGYSKNLFDVAWESPDRDMISHLQNNVYQFSFAKCNEQLKAATTALYDKDGKIIPFNEFKEICTRINQEFAVHHLKVEYNTAIGSAQMASRWIDYNTNKTFKNGTYRTVGDRRVGADHRPLDGITKPLSDAWWDTYWPPNRFGCRCDVDNTNQAVTPADKTPYPEVPSLFATNMAKDGLAFPEGHVFFQNLPADVQTAANNSNPFSYDKLHEGKDGGYVYNNPLSNMKPHEKAMAELLANKGDKVIMLPEINPDTEARKSLRELTLPGKVKKGKNPDALINGSLVEMKRCTTSAFNTISNRIYEGSKQADILCLKLEKEIKPKDLKRILNGKAKQIESLNEVWIVNHKDKLKKYTREGMLKLL